MARAIWTGAISFGLVTIPVKLVSAVRDHALHFHYVHRKDGGRIHNERVCDACGEKVAWADVARAFPYDKNDSVLLSDEDFEKATAEASHSVDIVEFVNATEIDPIFFDVPYYLEPERKGRRAYALLRDALSQTGKVGIARVVMRTREHLAALKPEGGAMVIAMMRWAEDVVPASTLDLPAREKQSAKELKMATTLIETMSARFAPGEFKDRYRAELLKLIEARAHGKSLPRAPGPKAATNVIDLADVLKKSLAQVKRESAGREKGKTVRAAAARRSDDSKRPRGRRASGA